MYMYIPYSFYYHCLTEYHNRGVNNLFDTFQEIVYIDYISKSGQKWPTLQYGLSRMRICKPSNDRVDQWCIQNILLLYDSACYLLQPHSTQSSICIYIYIYIISIIENTFFSSLPMDFIISTYPHFYIKYTLLINITTP